MQRLINNHLITFRNPVSPISEAYRTLRTNIQFSTIETTVKVLMVASAEKGEGKTTTVSNLAVAYAQEGKNVLLIDSDLRTPALHDVFSQQNRVGLSSVLANQAQWQEVVKETEVSNLTLLPSGPIPPNPSELLSTRKMNAFLEEMRERYDMILIDTSPVMAVTDSLIVSSLCDGVILVVSAGRVEKELVKKAKANLERVNARILGVVFNSMKRKISANKSVYSI